LEFRRCFNFGANQDLKNSSQNIAWVFQGGLSLPNRDYYTKTDDKSKQTRADFVKHVARMFELLGDLPKKASKDGRRHSQAGIAACRGFHGAGGIARSHRAG
jgi:predicted metalloendopeptidase